MSNRSKCTACGVDILVSAAKDTGGLCKPCLLGQNAKESRWHWRPAVWISTILCSPLLLILAIPVGTLYCLIELRNFFAAIGWRIRMRMCGRFLNRRSLHNRIVNAGPGTLILDQSGIGSRYRNAWWTPDDVSSICPFQQPSDDEYLDAMDEAICPNWDRWCWDKYQNPTDGNASLVSGLGTKKLQQWLLTNHPDVHIVHTLSAMVGFAESNAAE